jgi:heavy metal sensor kinase
MARLRALETIRVRLTLWYVGFLAALLLVFAVIVAAAQLRNEVVELDGTLRAAALAARGPLVNRGSERHAGDVDDLGGGAQTEGLLSVRLLTPDGHLIGSTGDTRLALGMPTPHRWPADGPVETVRLPSGDRVRVYRGVMKDDAGRTIRVEAAGAYRDYPELERLLGAIALAAPPTLALAVLVGLFLAGTALRPLEGITRTARELSAGDLTRRIALRGPNDEIKRLADTFDEMLARLEAAFRSQQSFVADASHELRTPLTILQSHADLALSDPEADRAQYRQTLEVVSAEVRRLSRVVTGLLTLARADAGSLTVAVEPIDLAELCEEALCRLRPLAAQRALTYEGPPELMLEGDPDWLRQLLLNLVENAIHHTAPDGTIRITSQQANDRIQLQVHDNGCGIAPQHLAHLFDRFYRVDKARSRARGGAGLGLSIAGWIVEQHGGSINIASQPGVGTTMVVTLPAATDNGTPGTGGYPRSGSTLRAPAREAGG